MIELHRDNKNRQHPRRGAACCCFNKMNPHYETSMALVTFSFGSVFGMVMVRCRPQPWQKSVVKTCTFRVSRYTAHHHAVAKTERIHGVMGAYWNPRTHEMTVRYDARVTSARHIMHLVA